MKAKLFFILICCSLFSFCSEKLIAQDQISKWNPEEQRELFGYCEKNILINDLKIPEEKADKIGNLNYWATLQKIKVRENINDTFATENEVEAELYKKYKSLGLAADQIKNLIERRKQNSSELCPIVTLHYNPVYDTAQKAFMILNFKTKYRKDMISKLGINGRQADQLIDAEVWKQKEACSIAKIPENNFDRIRKTVEMYHMLERKYTLFDLTEQQKSGAIEYFRQVQ